MDPPYTKKAPESALVVIWEAEATERVEASSMAPVDVLTLYVATMFPVELVTKGGRTSKANY